MHQQADVAGAVTGVGPPILGILPEKECAPNKNIFYSFCFYIIGTAAHGGSEAVE